MIRYGLICEAAHEFESWFSSSTGFEDLSARGLVSCPVCGSAKVGRAVMAPNVARTDKARPTPGPEPEAPAAAPTPAPAPVALMGEKEVELRRMLAELHRHVAETAENVGPRFAEEALAIHHGESEGRAIYGQATPDEAERLREEGVAFAALPRLPDSGH